MNLRASFPRLQLLFLLGVIAYTTLESSAPGDVVTTMDGRRTELKILGVNGPMLQVQVPAGTVGIPLASIKEVQMVVPPEFAAANRHFAAKEYSKALAIIKALTDKFKGVPVDWAQQATGMLGDLYITNNDLPKAEAAYKDFQRLYPGIGSTQAEVGMARVAISKNELAAAKQKLQPIADAALKEKFVPRANAFAYSQTFLALGQIKEKEGDLPGALEDYLRTITLFYHDPSAVSLAQERVDDLSARKITVP